ncbi:hypothetical protein LTR84_003039 [Exophiala bonariae]|uniref:Cytochrome P450 n=1 Tax=Exophiala bonariae TaxID=1690606 RepID=A0AAV9NBN6_9EURO|nr:hypothetical protein LTR84_003039 [Exophiala bonariae]
MIIVAFLLLLLVVLVPLVNHYKDPKGLRRFPTPSFWALTPLWAAYHNWHGRRFLAVDEAHRRRGPVLRLGPEHLSFASPGAYKEIYGHGSAIIKDVFYDNLAGKNPAMANTSSRPLHSERRKAVSAIFAAKHVSSMEPKVQYSVEKLLYAIQAKAEGRMVSTSDEYPANNGVFDLRPWMNMFSFDAFSNMMWSSCYNFLDRGNDSCFAMDHKGAVTTVNAMKTFQSGVHWNTICAQFSPPIYSLGRWLTSSTADKQAADHFAGMARYLTVQRIKMKPEEPDFFTNLPYDEASEKSRTTLNIDQLVAECDTYLNAGNDTTQISLTNTMFELASHPEKQQKLYDILLQGLPESSRPVASYTELCQIPYLRAVLDESFRLLPPVRFGLLRRTTGHGATISGHTIPAGVTVSSSVYTMHRDSNLFHNPSEWIPERWLPDTHHVSDAERQNLKDYVLPFTLGGRACIGRNLAYMELSICVAAMVLSFEWTITPEAKKSFTHYERFNSSPVCLMISAKARCDEKLSSEWNSS